MHVAAFILVCLSMIGSASEAFPISHDTIPSKSHLALPEINIKGSALVAKRRGDTIVFAADRYKSADAIRIEALLSNVPGFRVEENGRISFNGKEIKKLLLDGDDLTDQNYQRLSRTLRSILVDSIQVLERFNDNRLLKNIDGKDDIAVNLVLKKSFFGKPNVNLVVATALKKSGELQAELVHLKKNAKHLLFFNNNDIGTKSLQQINMETSVADNGKTMPYRSWPFATTIPADNIIRDTYLYRNKDWGVIWITTFKLNPYHKLKLNYQTGVNRLWSNQFQDQLFMDKDSWIGIYSKTDLNHSLNQQVFDFQLEKDKKKNAISKYQISLYRDKMDVGIGDTRDLEAKIMISSFSRLFSKGIQFMQQQTWKANNKSTWTFDSKIGFANHQFTIDVQFKDSLAIQYIDHRGIQAQSGLTQFRESRISKFQMGLRTSIESITSSIKDHAMRATLIKYYFHANHFTQLNKKLVLENFWMIGDASFKKEDRQYQALIFHLEQSLVLRRKPIEPLRLSLGVLKNATEMRYFYIGSILTSGTTQMQGAQTPAFPLSLYVQLQYSKMDLYRGLTIGGYASAKSIYGDYMMAVGLHPYLSTIKTVLGDRQTNLMINLYLEKVIHAIRIKYRIQWNGMYTYIPSIFNNVHFVGQTRLFRIDNHLTSNWRKRYNFQLEHQYQVSLFSGFKSNSSSINSTQVVRITMQYQLSNSVHVGIGSNHYTGKGFVSLHLLDVKMNGVMLNKYRLYVQGNNLLNRKVFIQQVVGVNSIGTNRQALVGRRMVIGVDVPL
jgi:hypothetical protein